MQEQVSFNFFKAMKYPIELGSCFQIEVSYSIIHDTFELQNPSDIYEACIMPSQSTITDLEEIEVHIVEFQKMMRGSHTTWRMTMLKFR